MRAIVGLVLLCWCGMAIGQNVYRCKVDGATVYSQTPCAESAEKVEVKEQPPMGAASEEQLRQMKANYESRIAGTKAGLAEAACIEDASRRIYTPFKNREAIAREKIRRLRTSMAYSNNNTAGATRDTGLQTEISGLESDIVTERTAADLAMEEARTNCARLAREQAQQPGAVADPG